MAFPYVEEKRTTCAVCSFIFTLKHMKLIGSEGGMDGYLPACQRENVVSSSVSDTVCGVWFASGEKEMNDIVIIHERFSELMKMVSR